MMRSTPTAELIRRTVAAKVFVAAITCFMHRVIFIAYIPFIASFSEDHQTSALPECSWSFVPFLRCVLRLIHRQTRP
uniref:Uncharacterized protein n=1 Tax=Hyaloperonospora arabidopsidis (strain Emoy2) TaxID=559515 RepID=M4B3H1_HYAAE